MVEMANPGGKDLAGADEEAKFLAQKPEGETVVTDGADTGKKKKKRNKKKKGGAAAAKEDDLGNGEEESKAPVEKSTAA